MVCLYSQARKAEAGVLLWVASLLIKPNGINSRFTAGRQLMTTITTNSWPQVHLQTCVQRQKQVLIHTHTKMFQNALKYICIYSTISLFVYQSKVHKMIVLCYIMSFSKICNVLKVYFCKNLQNLIIIFFHLSV